jgi:hypothetical protein
VNTEFANSVNVDLIDVAPTPLFSALGGLNDGVIRLDEMGARVTIL